ncbi:MAG: glycosidase, partial [Flavobacteriales bacterium]|nr:glycosidase [Flavobacteriales bacterium]
MDQANSSTWTIEGFVKVDSLNPILTPSAGLSFTDPITKKKVNWEERNVLNPSA